MLAIWAVYSWIDISSIPLSLPTQSVRFLSYISFICLWAVFGCHAAHSLNFLHGSVGTLHTAGPPIASLTESVIEWRLGKNQPAVSSDTGLWYLISNFCSIRWLLGPPTLVSSLWSCTSWIIVSSCRGYGHVDFSVLGFHLLSPDDFRCSSFSEDFPVSNALSPGYGWPCCLWDAYAHSTGLDCGGCTTSLHPWPVDILCHQIPCTVLAPSRFALMGHGTLGTCQATGHWVGSASRGAGVQIDRCSSQKVYFGRASYYSLHKISVKEDNDYVDVLLGIQVCVLVRLYTV